MSIRSWHESFNTSLAASPAIESKADVNESKPVRHLIRPNKKTTTSYSFVVGDCHLILYKVTFKQ